MPELEDQVAKLENRVLEVHRLLQYAPRAFVIEFAGTPKSGKSTSAEAIRHLFARHDYQVTVLKERAELCPIPMKGHLFFNTWCAATMLAELLANVETETDILIVDRGLFDALVWLTSQERRGEVTNEEARTIEAFLLLDRWRRLFDLAVVMNVSAVESITRERAQRITAKGGSIMNQETLTAMSESVSDAVLSYGSKFPAVINHETTGHQVRESNVALAGQILDHLEGFLNPEILVVRRGEIESLPLKDGGAFGDQAVSDVIECIAKNSRFMKRDEAESNFNYVQVIPCGLMSHDSRIFLFRRKETDPKSHLYGRTTIWHGCHVTRQQGVDTKRLLETSLLEKVSRSLFLSRGFPIDLLGYCWDRDDEIGSRHIGVVHRIEIDNPHTEADLRRKEFRRQRGHGLSGRFAQLNELAAGEAADTLESWSTTIVDWLRRRG